MAIIESIIEWFRANPDVFGFFVASLIYISILILVAFRLISFRMTLFLLLFALFSGLTVGNQHVFKKWLVGNQQEKVTEIEESQ